MKKVKRCKSLVSMKKVSCKRGGEDVKREGEYDNKMESNTSSHPSSTRLPPHRSRRRKSGGVLFFRRQQRQS